MMRLSLFVAQEREAKRNKLGDMLQVLDRHMDFAALATEADQAAQGGTGPVARREAARRK